MTTRFATVFVALGTLLIGSLVAIGTSYASLRSYATRAGGPSVSRVMTPPSAAPSPAPVARGVLGTHPHLTLSGNVLLASGDNILLESDDGGKTFRPIALPVGAVGLVIAASNPRRRLTGGISLRLSDDGGSSWRLPPSNPPAPGPYTVLAINPLDGDVWFVAAHGRLLRTRDGGISWREIAGISTDSNSLVVPTGRRNEFVVSAGDEIYELVDNGQQIRPRPGLPSPARPLEIIVAGNDQNITLLARGSDGKDYLDGGGGWQASVPLAGPVAAVPGKWMVVGDGAGTPTAAQTESSSDLGRTWSAGEGLPSGESVDALGSSPDTSTVYAYTYGGSLLKSTDGTNWTAAGGVLRS